MGGAAGLAFPSVWAGFCDFGLTVALWAACYNFLLFLVSGHPWEGWGGWAFRPLICVRCLAFPLYSTVNEEARSSRCLGLGRGAGWGCALVRLIVCSRSVRGKIGWGRGSA